MIGRATGWPRIEGTYDLSLIHKFRMHGELVDEGREGTRTVTGSARLMSSQLDDLMVNVPACYRQLLSALWTAIRGQAFALFETEAQYSVSVDLVVLVQVEVEKQAKLEQQERTRRRRRAAIKKTRKLAKVKIRELIPAKRRGAKYVVSWWNESEGLPKEVIRYETRAFGGKRQLVAIQRRYAKPGVDKRGDPVAGRMLPGGKWVSR